MFGKLKAKLGGGVNRFAGNTDFLEAVCASAALVAAADGDISDEEVAVAAKTVKSNATLNGAFKPAQIEKTIDHMLNRVSAGRTGRMEVFKELGDIDDAEMGETVYLTALDVAESCGDISSSERTMLEKIARTVGVNAAALEAI